MISERENGRNLQTHAYDRCFGLPALPGIMQDGSPW